MSDAEIWDDQDDDTELVRQLRKQVKTLTQSKSEAEARAAAAEGKLTVASLSDALKAKGVNPKAARFIVADGVDTSDSAALDSWLEENGDLFPSSSPEAAAQQQEQQQQPAVDGDVVDGYQQVAGVHQLQRPVDMNKLTEAKRGLPDNATPEQVLAAFRQQGL